VTFKTRFGLDDWIYWHLIQTTWDYRQYSAIATLHTFQFTSARTLGSSVFTSRILATYLQQSRCHFKSNMNSSFHSLIIPFCHFFSVTFDCHLQNTTHFFTTQMNSSSTERSQLLTTAPLNFSLNSLGEDPRKTPSSSVPYCFRRVCRSVA
jgi:hypothetical protein